MRLVTFDPAPCPEAAERAAGLLALPIKHRGRDRSAGVDCAGLIRLALEGRCGVPLPANYAVDWFRDTPGLTLAWAAKLWPPVRGVVKPWDVCVFRLFTTCGEHPGLYLGENKVLHAYDGRIAIDRITDACRRTSWVDRLAAVFRPIQEPAPCR